VNCPTGYVVTGGGFTDKYYTKDDQDASYPSGNGWYCEDDNSNGDSNLILCPERDLPPRQCWKFQVFSCFSSFLFC